MPEEESSVLADSVWEIQLVSAEAHRLSRLEKPEGSPCIVVKEPLVLDLAHISRPTDGTELL